MAASLITAFEIFRENIKNKSFKIVVKRKFPKPKKVNVSTLINIRNVEYFLRLTLSEVSLNVTLKNV